MKTSRRFVGGCGLQAELGGGAGGVVKVGGYTQTHAARRETAAVELLRLATGSWADMSPFDERWILHADSSPQTTYSSYSFLILDGKPTIIGGEYEIFLRDVEVDGRHMRDHVQIYQEEEDRWFCCLPSMNYKRSKFSAVKVSL